MTARESHSNELDELKGTFLSSLNHEIRTPLSGILGMTDLLLETSLDPDQLEYVQAARLCAENLFEILNATLEFSALEAGRFHLDSSEFSLREVLESLIAQHALKAKVKNIALRLLIDPVLPETAIGDGPRLGQLLGHLVANAIKFTQTGSVEVRALGEITDNFEWLVVEIVDTGIGIAPEKLGAIFQSFQQGERGLSRGYPGLGLGLALTRKLTAVMHGKLSVESEIGRGSKFTVRLPLERPSILEASIVVTEAASGPAILAVDDNSVGLTVLRHALNRRYSNVTCVSSGEEALAEAALKQFDLVVMDLQMPGMDGLEASELLRKIPGYDATPILALTANSSDYVREQCLAAGLQAYLSKPIEANQLLSTIARFLKA
jgi:CheY-like chemotaxis protein